MKPILPQHDDDAARRSATLAARRELPRYNYDDFPGPAMADAVPNEEKPSLQWLEMVAGERVEPLGHTARVEHAFLR